MKRYSPLTIAVCAIAVSFVWSISQLAIDTEQVVPSPLPTMAQVSGSGTVQN
jgi:hypothetical protein